MHVASPAMSLVLEMVMFNVGQAVTHFGFAAAECFIPECDSIPLDRHTDGNRIELRVDHQLRAKSTGAQLRASEIQIISFFELVVRKFVPCREPQPIGLAIWSNDVHSGDLCLFSTIFGVAGNIER